MQKTGKQQTLTAQQKYWRRRARLLATGKERRIDHFLKQKMTQQSAVPSFDVDLIFNKANALERKVIRKQKRHHATLVQQVKTALKSTSNGKCTSEADIEAVFGQRLHTRSSEAYYWEQTYLMIDRSVVIPIDHIGLAHLFPPAKSQLAAEETQNKTDSAQTETPSTAQPKKTPRWSCSNSLCRIDHQSIVGTNDLLQKLCTTTPTRCLHLYLNINKCLYTDKNPDKLGHSLSCSTDNGCQSRLKHLRAVSTHFPAARTMVVAIYKLVRLSLCIRALQQAKHIGDYHRLEAAISTLKEAETAVFGTTATETIHSTTVSREEVSEGLVMEKFAKQLRQVASERDTYITTACALCEQLKPNLRSLSSLESRKGFESEKMTTAVEVIYQHKTEYEDIEEFKENTSICSYCADKLLGNKDVARSAFNKLSVVDTPQCITSLNLFERTLIKFCMTCLTVIRLGQISGKRPQNELTPAMKGRIAYLPVDVEANAKFLPENLLNVDSLCVVVAGQPTKAHKVWTSLVDLTKLHSALTWLRHNNRLYQDIPAYTVEDIKAIIEQKLKDGNTYDPNPDSALLKKLDDASKSFLYENFSVQPLSSEYPKDLVADYQMNKINSNSSNIYDNDLDLKAFPELYPTAENGMRAARSTNLAPSDFIRSRLLNKNPKFRLNMNYLFHLFQQHEVNAMCHSVGHMLRTVTGRSMTAQELCDRLQRQDGEINSKLFGLMANVRGSREYFAKLAMDIRWIIRRLGPPTLFVTCSMAEWFSEPFISYLRETNRDVPGVERMTASELCAMDPVNVSIHFQKKWHSIFNRLICNKDNGIFGEVEDFFLSN